MEKQIHPHEVMADFVTRGVAYFEDLTILPPAKKGAYGRHRMALQYLGVLMRAENMDERTLQYTLNHADRFVADLELILSDDPHYKEFREELK